MEGDEIYLMLVSAVRTVFIREDAMRRRANEIDCYRILDLWVGMIEEKHAQNEQTYEKLGFEYINKQNRLFTMTEHLGDLEVKVYELEQKIEGLNNPLLMGFYNALSKEFEKKVYLDGKPSANFFSMNTKSSILSDISDLSESLDGTPVSLEEDSETSYTLPTPPLLERARPRVQLHESYIAPQPSPTPTIRQRPTLSRGTIGLPSAAPPAGVPIISPPKTTRPLRGTLVRSPTLPLQVLQAALPPQQDPMNRRQVLQEVLPPQQDPMNRRQVLQAALLPQQDPMNRRQVLQAALPRQQDPMNRRQVLQAQPRQRDSMNRRQVLPDGFRLYNIR